MSRHRNQMNIANRLTADNAQKQNSRLAAGITFGDLMHDRVDYAPASALTIAYVFLF